MREIDAQRKELQPKVDAAHDELKALIYRRAALDEELERVTKQGADVDAEARDWRQVRESKDEDGYCMDGRKATMQNVSCE